MLSRYLGYLWFFFITTCWNGVHFMSKTTLTPIKIKVFMVILSASNERREIFQNLINRNKLHSFSLIHHVFLWGRKG